MAKVELGAPIFIVGAGRSGTTLLQTLLSAHPEVAIPPETHYMRMADRFGAAVGDAPPDREAFWSHLTGWSRFRDLGVPAQAVAGLADPLGAGTFRDVFAAMLSCYAADRGKSRAGEKTPGHYRDWRRLLDWFPDARIVGIRRDPRAVAASALDTPWVREKMRPEGRLSPFLRRARLTQIAGQARGWQRIYGTYLPAAARDPRVILMSYESLVTSPGPTLERLCPALRLDYDAAMLEGRDALSGARLDGTGAAWDGWVARHEKAARAPVSSTGLDKWRGKLSAGEIAMIEDICAAGMAVQGYARESGGATSRRAGFMGRTALRLSDTELALRRRLGRGV